MAESHEPDAPENHRSQESNDEGNRTMTRHSGIAVDTSGASSGSPVRPCGVLVVDDDEGILAFWGSACGRPGSPSGWPLMDAWGG